MFNDLTSCQSKLSSVWPEWRIIRLLGNGSQGSVYEIHRNDFGKTFRCALKILHMECTELHNSDLEQITSDSPLYLSRFSNNSASNKTQGSYSIKNENEENTFRVIRSDKNLPVNNVANSLTHIHDISGPEDILEDFVQRISAEIDIMMRLKGAPHILSIEDYTVLREDNARTIMIRMELLESLDQYVNRCGSLGRDIIVQLGLDICSALEYCERKNIVHYNIKPSNIFYGEQTGFKIGDFRSCRYFPNNTEVQYSPSMLGVIQYLTPEEYLRNNSDNTVDIYALGIILYTLLNNNNPPLYNYESTNQDHLTEEEKLFKANMRRLNGEPLPLPSNAKDNLGTAVCMACSPNPSKRFQTVIGFKNALSVSGNVRKGEPSIAVHPSAVSSKNNVSGLWNKKLTLIVLSALIVSLFILVFFKSKGIISDSSHSVTNTVISEDMSGREEDNKNVNRYKKDEDSSATDSSHSAKTDYTSSKEDLVMSIPSDALVFNKHSYYLYDNDCNDWDEVLEFCKSKGGYPAVINDINENETLFNYMLSMGRSATLIGYTDRDTEGTWKWVNGQSSGFTDWGINDEGDQEPNSDSRSEDYAQLDINMLNGHWNDAAFGKNTASFICEWDGVNN